MGTGEREWADGNVERSDDRRSTAGSVLASRRRVAMSRTGTCLVIAVAALTVASACRQAAPPAAAPPEVYITAVLVQDVPEYLELAGQTEGFEDVDIRARVEGF